MSFTFDQIGADGRARFTGRISEGVRRRMDGKDKNPDPAEKQQGAFLDVGKLRTQYMDYLTTKVDEIEEQKMSRHYYHGAQWTPEQLEILRKRHQPVLTWNRVGRKINAIIGLVERSRADPKAFPRHPNAEQGANIATETIRYVLDTNDWKGIDPWCLLQSCIDGIAGVQLQLVQGDHEDPDLALSWVIGDEYFYDPKAYRLDLSDARYEGLSKWLDLDEAITLFPDKEEILRALVSGDSDLTTNADREYKWVITATQRVRLIEHWYKHRGEWYWAFYISNVLLDEGLSPFFDEKGKRCSSFRMFSVAVDHDGDRYGFVRNLKGPQDSLNQGKSKTLHIANSRRLIMDKGAVDDVEKTRIEWARPDGIIEKNPGASITPDDKTQDLAQFNKFVQDATQEIDAFANTNVAALSGAQITNISGRAIELLRQPGLAELGPFVLAYRQWKLRLYRLIWSTVQRTWKAERWIRVTNNEGLAKFIQVNGLGFNQWNQPTLVNFLGALDVDIILEEGPDVTSTMQETYDMLRAFPPGSFPPAVLIELSSMPRADKVRILQMMTPKPPPPNPQAQLAQHLALENAAGKNAKLAADVRSTHAKADLALSQAAEHRAKAGGEVIDAHIAASEFARDTLLEAAKIAQPQPAPQMPAQSGAGAPRPQPMSPQPTLPGI